MSASATFSQQTGSSTPTPIDKREQVVAALERAQSEVRAGRALIADYEVRIEKLEKQVSVEKQNNGLLTQAYLDAVKELAEIRAALKAEREAQSLRERQVEELRERNKQLEKKLSSARKRELVTTVVAVIVLAIKLF